MAVLLVISDLFQTSLMLNTVKHNVPLYNIKSSHFPVGYAKILNYISLFLYRSLSCLKKGTYNRQALMIALVKVYAKKHISKSKKILDI